MVKNVAYQLKTADRITEINSRYQQGVITFVAYCADVSVFPRDITFFIFAIFFTSAKEVVFFSFVCLSFSGASGGFILGATGVATLSSGGGHTANTFALNYRVCNRRYEVL